MDFGHGIVIVVGPKAKKMTGQGKIILVDAKIFFSGFRNRLRLPRNWPLSVYSKTQRSIAKALSGERRKQTLIR